MCLLLSNITHPSRRLLLWIVMLTPSASALPVPPQEPIDDSGKGVLRQAIKQLFNADGAIEGKNKGKAGGMVREKTGETLFLGVQFLFNKKKLKDWFKRVQRTWPLEHV